MTNVTDNRTTELLPCPFCGGMAVLDEYASEEMNISVNHADDCWFMDYEYTYDVPSDEKEMYVKAWNTRAATLGGGNLTADDVRDLIERHSDAAGGNGRDFHNGAYTAIADELNATLGSNREKALEGLVRDMWREITTCSDYATPPCMTTSICERVRNLEIEVIE